MEISLEDLYEDIGALRININTCKVNSLAET